MDEEQHRAGSRRPVGDPVSVQLELARGCEVGRDLSQLCHRSMIHAVMSPLGYVTFADVSTFTRFAARGSHG
jgi:hypothetical protein